MAFLTKYGTIWGAIPQTAGSVFWVAPSDGYTVDGRAYRASDNNDGLSPERALRTIDRAWNLVDANAGDVILLIPNGASAGHIVTGSSVAADIAGVSMFGLPSGRGNRLRNRTSVTTTVTGDEIINVTAADIEFGYFDIIPITASDGIDLTAAADGFYMHNFKIDMATPAVSTSTVGITMAAAEDILIEDFSVICDGAQGNAIVATAAIDSQIRNGTMLQSAGTWASAILCGAATTQLHIDHVDFLPANATLTDGINGTGATIASGVLITRCLFADSVGTAVGNFGAGEAELAENFQLGVGSTDGGVLITAIS
jgi:hypothetical protein